jgi:hypothetical protein
MCIGSSLASNLEFVLRVAASIAFGHFLPLIDRNEAHPPYRAHCSSRSVLTMACSFPVFSSKRHHNSI